MINLKNLEEIIQKEGFVVSHINGNSMHPFLYAGKDSVVISKINRDIHLYDVVLYKKEDKYVLHRIIEINNDEYLIRGDNCIALEHINKNDVIGVLVGYYNKDNYIEINDQINTKYYKKSKRTLLLRKLIKKIIS